MYNLNINMFNSNLIIVIVSLLSGFVLSMIFAPLAFLLTKTLVHRCTVCQKHLGTDGKLFFYLPYKDKVFTYKFIKDYQCKIPRIRIYSDQININWNNLRNNSDPITKKSSRL